jgi:hypothetical protein
MTPAFEFLLPLSYSISLSPGHFPCHISLGRYLNRSTITLVADARGDVVPDPGPRGLLYCELPFLVASVLAESITEK